MTSKDENEFNNNPKVQELTKIKAQIEHNLEKLNNALISNDLLFLHLLAASTQDSPKENADSENKHSTPVDNLVDINKIELDLGETSKQKTAKPTFDDEEIDSDEDDESD